MFIMCLEYLSILIEKELIQENWHGIKVSERAMTSNHPLFADDMTMLCEVTDRTPGAIHRVLPTFGEMSRQKVNW